MHIDEFLEKHFDETKVYFSDEAKELAQRAWMAGMAHARSLLLIQKLRFDAICDQQNAKAADLMKQFEAEDEKEN